MYPSSFLLISFLLVFPLYAYTQSNNNTYPKGSCQHPYKITDSLFALQKSKGTQDKIWFVFKAPASSFFIEVLNDRMEKFDYMIFRYKHDDFCESIKNRLLIAERNKVCNEDLELVSAARLSYENMHRGVCSCSRCCHSKTVFKAEKDAYYAILVYAKGQNVNIKFHTKSTKSLPKHAYHKLKENKALHIENISVGKTVIIEDIFFHAGSEQILRSSLNALNDLYDFLNKNQNVKIEIQGHVNAPGERPNMKHSNDLGTKRAKTVYDYLVHQGIEPRRLSYKGYGNTRMLYPNARSAEEMSKNRRVEILIMSK